MPSVNKRNLNYGNDSVLIFLPFKCTQIFKLTIADVMPTCSTALVGMPSVTAFALRHFEEGIAS